MKQKKFEVINKSVKGEEQDSVIHGGELELINNFTRRKLREDEVYVFSVVLCDNDIDRQNEKFSNASLDKLAKLFVGKTGIMDHNVLSENQTARIFSCKVQDVSGKMTCTGEPYKRLVARAYMPKTEKNQEFIMQIDSGIKKEVSISCAVENITCSVCGTNIKTGHCKHVKGRTYKNGKQNEVCYYILDNPIDAYEWSFVVVPAQREAGVIKSFVLKSNGGEMEVQDVMKELSLGNDINLTSSQAVELYERIKSLEKKAEIGEEYYKELKSEVLTLSAAAQPEIEISVMKSLVEKMSVGELKSFKDAYKKRVLKGTSKPQLSHGSIKKSSNTQFKI